MIVSGIGGAITGLASALSLSRVHRMRTDARLTWLEDAMSASLMFLAELGRENSPGRRELLLVLSKAPRVRG